MVLLYRISLGDGMFGPTVVDLRSSRSVTRGLLVAKAVLRAVLIVLTCLSIKPFDWGNGGRMYGVLCNGVQEIL